MSGDERRLHPLTLVFAVGRGLREAVAPAALALLAGRSRADTVRAVFAAMAVGVPVTIMIARYLTFRYRFEARELVLRSGVVIRQERHLPYERIQNVDATQNLLHRLLRVTSVQIQTAGGGGTPEASLSVLSHDAVGELRTRIAQARSAPRETPDEAPTAPEPEPAAESMPAAPPRLLLALPVAELARAGFIENRGLAFIVAALAPLLQFELVIDTVFQWLRRVTPGIEWSTLTDRALTHPHEAALAGLVTIGLLLLLVRLVSTLWAVVRLYDYRLWRDGDVLRFEYGLLTRVVGAVPLRRIQTVTVHRRLLHRLLGRAEVRITTAGGGIGAKGRSARQPIVPIVAESRVAALLEELHPGHAIANAHWHSPHPAAARRVLARPGLFALTGSAAALHLFGWWGLPVALGLAARAALLTRLTMRNHGWAALGDGIALRLGALHTTLTLARHARIQGTMLLASPLDRRTGMARVVVDTAGWAIVIPYLDCDAAHALRRDLAVRAEATGFVW